MFTLIIVILYAILYTLNVFSARDFILKNIILLFTMAVKVTDNAIADSISRLPRLESLLGDNLGSKSSASTSNSKKMSIKFYSTSKLSNNCTWALINGHN